MLPIDFLYRGLRRNPSAVAVRGGGETLTYHEFVTRVEALAAGLQDTDPNPHSRVGICAYNTIEHMTALLATYAAGKVWVPLNPRNGKAELDATIESVQVSLIVADESCLDRFSRPDVPLIVGRTTTSPKARDTVAGLIDRFRGRAPQRLHPSLDGAQAIKHTGGSTGRPKGVIQPYRCINTQAVSVLHAFDYDQQECNLIAAPLTHGTSCFVLPVFAQGGQQVLLETPTPATILDAFVEYGVTTVFLPPTLIHMLMAEPGVESGSWSALRHMIYSAAPMTPEKITAAREIFGNVIETAYGQVEAPGIITAMRAAELSPDTLASVGRSSLLTRVEIMGPDGALLPAGELGEVVVRGDLVMSGYLDMPDRTAQAIGDGWLHTGDLGALDDRGYLYLKSRMSDMIISGGFNVYPADVESALSGHPAVYECCVYGVEDDKWGEAVHAAVRLHRDRVATEIELITFVKQRLDSVKAPKRIHLVEDLPRNPVGKVSRRSVRKAMQHILAVKDE